MVNFFSKIIGKTKVKAEGLNQNRHLKNLCDKGISIYDLKRKNSSEMEFCVDTVSLQKVKEEFKNYKTFKEQSKNGLSGILTFIKNNVIVFFCFILFLSSIPFVNLFVWQIKICGANEKITDEIEIFLKEQNIEIGKLKNRYEVNAIKSKLLENFNNFAFVDVCVIGQSLVVGIKEKTFEATNNFNLKPLICDYDGIVESVNIKSGTAKIKSGDFVKRGDILAEPFIIRDGKFLKSEVVGTVKIRCFLTQESLFFENQEIKVRTGNKLVKNDFTLFKKFDKLKLGKIKFKDYEINVVLKNKNVFPIIPIKMTSVEIFELEMQKVYKKFDDCKQDFEDSLISKTNFEIYADEIIDSNVKSEKVEEGVYKTTYYVDFFKTY